MIDHFLEVLYKFYGDNPNFFGALDIMEVYNLAEKFNIFRSFCWRNKSSGVVAMKISHSDHCVGCLKKFKRLLTHLAHNAVCASHYAVHNKSAATILTITIDDHLNTNHVFEGTTCSRLNVSLSSSRRFLLGKESGTIFKEADNNELHVKDVNKFEDDLWAMMTRFHMFMLMIRMYQKVIRSNVKLITVILICMRRAV
jgi:hypothetical protein